ncbi:4'-phosphopantetheinyl transferase EntD (siderophore biosynthesis) [Maridesulfovibrio ferrireducens]|uniref:Enterobactin synthase component D n=1 Tax=Maridesulfovibrio ferrireducens TaxID=246191 RepID=A0A1G9KUK9_9BACT|nr:4'-phosphopantetheinyl transferase superfamily protein [Maridesulfovibrio ferrireducens]SDL53372.1 4'-phosphopantetheinyl transferase EntD (siderophore biosynthesis) [Maridesulfovibrio ferrireducens]
MPPSSIKHCKDSFLDILFPDSVVTAESLPHISRSSLHEDEWEIVADSVPERQAEFCGGRVCAHQALKQLGMADSAILQNKDRSPRWPDNVTGSISHTQGYCAAAVAKKDDIEGVGLDVELDSPLDWKLSELICSPQELIWLSSYPLSERSKLAKIFFSTKEAAFKCQFPITQEFIDYAQAEITLDFNELSFNVIVTHKSPEVSLVCSKIHGRYEVKNGFILSGATILKD